MPVTCPGTPQSHQKNVKRANLGLAPGWDWACPSVRCYTSSGHHRRNADDQKRDIRGPQVAEVAPACDDDDGNETLRWFSSGPVKQNRLWQMGFGMGWTSLLDGELDEKTKLFYICQSVVEGRFWTRPDESIGRSAVMKGPEVGTAGIWRVIDRKGQS